MADIMEITDLTSPELDIYARLNETQLRHLYEPKPGIFIAESPRVIGRALDAGCVPLSFLMETKHTEGKARDILARCPEDINVYTAELEVLTQLTGFHLTRGMLCAMLRPKLRKVEDVCCGARRIAVLENVMNPTNIGAIFRSAAALGMDAVLLTAEGSDPLYRRAVRVSMGTVFQVPWTYLGEDWMGHAKGRLGLLIACKNETYEQIFRHGVCLNGLRVCLCRPHTSRGGSFRMQGRLENRPTVHGYNVFAVSHSPWHGKSGGKRLHFFQCWRDGNV